MTAVFGALASGVFAGLIVLAGYQAAPSWLAGAVAVAVLVLAVGWGRLLDLPARRGTGVLIAAIGCGGAALAVWATTMTRPLAPFAALLAGGILLAFAHELMRRHGRPKLVESVSGTVSGETVALLGGGWLLLPGTRLGLHGLVTGAAAAAAARLVTMLPVPQRFAGWLSLIVGTAAGGLVGARLEQGRALPLLIEAAVVASAVAGLDRVLLAVPGRRPFLVVLSGAAAPVLAVGTVAYAVARLVA